MAVIVCQDIPTFVYSGSDVIALPVKRQFERVELSPQVTFCRFFFARPGLNFYCLVSCHFPNRLHYSSCLFVCSLKLSNQCKKTKVV